MALELLLDGNVESLRKAHNGEVPEPLVRQIISDVTEALKTLRSSKVETHIYHRDIKPENIMVKKDADGEYERFVLIDFGFSVAFNKDESLKHSLGEKGTPAYIDP